MKARCPSGPVRREPSTKSRAIMDSDKHPYADPHALLHKHLHLHGFPFPALVYSATHAVHNLTPQHLNETTPDRKSPSAPSPRAPASSAPGPRTVRSAPLGFPWCMRPLAAYSPPSRRNPRAQDPSIPLNRHRQDSRSSPALVAAGRCFTSSSAQGRLGVLSWPSWFPLLRDCTQRRVQV